MTDQPRSELKNGLEVVRKTLRAVRVKNADQEKEPGVYDAIVSVFGNVDDGYDRVVAGAFADAIKANPNPPVVWAHRWDIPPIGETLDVAELAAGDPRLAGTGLEDLGGLWTKNRLFIAKDEDHQVARQVHAGMKAGAVREFSFAYTVAESAWVTEDGVEIRELTKIGEIFEQGPCLIGMNRQTALLEVASNLHLPPSQAAPPGSGDNNRTIDPAQLVKHLARTRYHGG